MSVSVKVTPPVWPDTALDEIIVATNLTVLPALIEVTGFPE